MTLDEKISKSIDAKLEEQATLFNDAHDDVGDILGILKTLEDQIPLLQDIKTEVKQLQNNQVTQPEKSEDEPTDDPKHDPSPSDPDLPKLRQALRDAVKGIDKAKRIASPLRKALPSADDPIPDWVKDTDWYNLASDIYKVYKLFQISKDMDDKYGTLWSQIKSLMDGEKTWQEFWKEQEEQSFEALDRAMDVLNSDLEEEFSRMFQLGENISDSLQLCCQNTQTGLSNIDDKVEQISEDMPNGNDVATLCGEAINSPSSLTNAFSGLRGLL